jgi:hypothetical protein
MPSHSGGSQADAAALLKARKGRVDVVDVPELAFTVVTGSGDPDGPEFQEATQALYSVSYGAHFMVKQQAGTAPKVMPLEALWWVDDPAQQELVLAVVTGEATMGDTDRSSWQWQAMIQQPDQIGPEVVQQAIDEARRKKPLPALDRLTYLRWTEGTAAQILHVGPYRAEGPTIRALHDGIAAVGLQPRGRHHEIYLGDPRRSAPEKLRTLLRQPVEPGT